jgi:5-methylcytosine-specific restriction protein B
MLSYQEYEKAVYDSLMEKRNTDSKFNFSVRQKASKGAEKDYFIGTEKGRYFGTTFWYVRVGFPGSAGDLINLFFWFTPDSKLGYNFECNQTTSPHDDQNTSALELIKNLEPLFESNIGLSKKSKPSQKVRNYKTKSRKPFYDSVKEMMGDVFKDAEVIIPLVNQEITKIKSKHPEFIAHQFSDEEFDYMQQKLTARRESPVEADSEEEPVPTKSKKKKPEVDSTTFPVNQIFFGPPGTGKTYHTINEALRIVGVETKDKTRAEIKLEFDKKLVEGQIVFTTFHQSLNYEEFIEGIKPRIVEGNEEDQKLDYHVNPGIFKKLSIEASFDLAKSQMSKETEETLDFSNLYDMFVEQVEEKLLNDETVEIKTKSGGTVIIDSISEKSNIIVKHPNGTREYIVSKARLTKVNNAFDNLDAVSNINDEFRGVIGGSNSSAYWSVLNAIKKINNKVRIKVQEKTYSFDDKVEVVKKMTREEYRTSTGKNFVLIIDEINRGNVSQIFGELITLIEKDKRLGRDEDLKVTLPYSGDKFGVPPNLYIIGTMNTADRSVEALDTALRRRFSFTEMPPLPELLEPNLVLQRLWFKYFDLKWNDPVWVKAEQDFLDLHQATIIDRDAYEELEEENDLNLLPSRFSDLIHFQGINLDKLLQTINRRIEKLLDRDHLIGHSYFIQTYSWEDLKQSMYENIIPLLQEYFYGDYAKIGAILGQGFIRRENGPVQTEFALGYEGEGDNQRDVFHIVDYREGYPGNQYIQTDMTFKMAIKQLMNLPTE